MGRRHYVPMRRHHDVPIRRREDVLLRRRWVFHLGHACDVTGTYRDVVTTSPRRFVAGWVGVEVPEDKLERLS